MPSVLDSAYEFSPDPARVQVDAVHAYLRRSYWSPGVRREIIENSIRHSSAVLGVYLRSGDARGGSSGAQVGYARVISDCATFAYLCDVYVLEVHRGRGLSKRMVEMLLADPRFATVRRWALATRDAHGLYEQYGFGPVTPGRWMERKSAESVWREFEPG